MDERRDYDVIVIGAGAGGLTAAAYLAMTGRRVAVIDAREQPGGHMSAFTHAGYEFDIGLHYTVAAPVQQILQPLGVQVEFRELDPDAMIRLIGPGRELAVPKDMDAFRVRLHEAFPEERQTIDTFLSTAQMLSDERQMRLRSGLTCRICRVCRGGCADCCATGLLPWAATSTRCMHRRR